MPMIVNQGSAMIRVLLLGGTTEASAMARALAVAGVPAMFSYAGRTAAPASQPLPMRIGGFGGVEGLAAFIVVSGISHVIDATHPFAAQMSNNAVAACAIAGVPLVALEREAWVAGAGDDWRGVADVAGAVEALPETASRVFLAIGKQWLPVFAERLEHYYLLRLVDPPLEPLPFPRFGMVVGRGPFTLPGDVALLREHGITHIVAKNSGGAGARAKLEAARKLGLPVIMIERPAVSQRRVLRSVGEVMDWLDHAAEMIAERGV
jgi:precorrin-6A/cobalt-precorrin-6A reductase